MLDGIDPNLVEPVTNSIEEDIVCTTKVRALIVFVTTRDPVIVVLPDIATAPLFTNNTADAVAAFTDPSDTNILP